MGRNKGSTKDRGAAERSSSLPRRVAPAEHVVLRARMGSHDAHYAGGLVDGARVLQLFGDVATALLIRMDGDEGLFRAYDDVEFLAPVRAGDFIEAEGWITEVGKTSRKMRFEARKVIALLEPGEPGCLAPSSARVIDEPIVVCRASGTCVTPAGLQRLETSPPAGKGALAAPVDRKR